MRLDLEFVDIPDRRERERVGYGDSPERALASVSRSGDEEGEVEVLRSAPP